MATPERDRVQVSDEKMRGLRRFNAVMGLLHLVQGVFMIAVSNDPTYPIFTNSLSLDLATFSWRRSPSCSTNCASVPPWRPSC